MRFAYLGPSGTFTEAALLKVDGAAEAERVPMPSVPAALDAVRTGAADAAMVPIENSVEGGVTATLDAIAAADGLRIVAEQMVPITFVLAARPGVALADVRGVSTHGHAWAQVSEWVAQNLPDAAYFPAGSTAAAAQELAGGEAPFEAAVCSPLVAEQLGLAVLGEDIGTVKDAVTRFVLVAPRGLVSRRTGADKTTLVVSLPENRPGALMDILNQFASRGANLSRIESRPTGRGIGSYFFSIDVDGHVSDARIAAALRGLKRIADVTFLGSYPRADGVRTEPATHTSDEAYRSADAWFEGLFDER
ncbi:prephenate dehydratase [Falsarthrobacter nasiphocae]|uniref:Prephenate dehydratase n=1 Tax=Falsarthrobacter nasiphocae TaxID=189863 RepID=A0AAE4C834_9MICC|nr:prephenate dehydratase [Falsarthrobacter nasiphocae]MDR6892000.1 prephenate dehydratase [Falsarthrobacter nasiphocae]